MIKLVKKLGIFTLLCVVSFPVVVFMANILPNLKEQCEVEPVLLYQTEHFIIHAILVLIGLVVYWVFGVLIEWLDDVVMNLPQWVWYIWCGLLVVGSLIILAYFSLGVWVQYEYCGDLTASTWLIEYFK